MTSFLQRLSHKISKEVIYIYNDIFKPSFNLPSTTILCFHGIDEVGNTRINSRFLSAEKFRAFLKLCLDKQVEFITVKDAFEVTNPSNKPQIALTFDDGYRNIKSHLLPILEEFNVPASIYITTVRAMGMDMLWTDCLDLSAYINHNSFKWRGDLFVYSGKKGYRSHKTGQYLKALAKKERWPYLQEMMSVLPGASEIRLREDLKIYWELLNEEEIKLLSQSPLIQIGAHGVTHSNLEVTSLQESIEEINTSKAFLEQIIQRKITELAYPFGKFSEELIDYAKSTGFQRQLIDDTENRVNALNTCLNRRIINPHISNFNQLTNISKNPMAWKGTKT
ncbi:MAG: polysaccharide deacetylase family protein [Saprospiraceae bacterium]|nr:polysaccharide deacetylase family protein [Saprospiraceae bacterium]